MHIAGWQRGRAEIPLDTLPLPPPRPFPRSSPERLLTPVDPLDKADRQFLERLRVRPLARRLLQQTLWRDCPALIFNHKRKQLARQGYLGLHKGSYSLTHKGAAAIAREDVSISRTAFSARGYAEFFGNGGVYRKYRIKVQRGGVDSPVLVTAEPLTPASPRLERDTFLVWNHALVEAAFLEAVQRLEALPGNAGLCRRVRGRQMPVRAAKRVLTGR